MEPSLDETFMLQAIEEAKKGKSKGDLPFGAIVVHNGEVVGRGRAENGTIGDVTDHAELMALREACRTLKRNNLNDALYMARMNHVLCVLLGFFKQKLQMYGLVYHEVIFLFYVHVNLV